MSTEIGSSPSPNYDAQKELERQRELEKQAAEATQQEDTNTNQTETNKTKNSSQTRENKTAENLNTEEKLAAAIPGYQKANSPEEHEKNAELILNKVAEQIKDSKEKLGEERTEYPGASKDLSDNPKIAMSQIAAQQREDKEEGNTEAQEKSLEQKETIYELAKKLIDKGLFKEADEILSQHTLGQSSQKTIEDLETKTLEAKEKELEEARSKNQEELKNNDENIDYQGKRLSEYSERKEKFLGKKGKEVVVKQINKEIEKAKIELSSSINKAKTQAREAGEAEKLIAAGNLEATKKVLDGESTTRIETVKFEEPKEGEDFRASIARQARESKESLKSLIQTQEKIEKEITSNPKLEQKERSELADKVKGIETSIQEQARQTHGLQELHKHVTQLEDEKRQDKLGKLKKGETSFSTEQKYNDAAQIQKVIERKLETKLEEKQKALETKQKSYETKLKELETEYTQKLEALETKKQEKLDQIQGTIDALSGVAFQGQELAISGLYDQKATAKQDHEIAVKRLKQETTQQILEVQAQRIHSARSLSQANELIKRGDIAGARQVIEKGTYTTQRDFSVQFNAQTNNTEEATQETSETGSTTNYQKQSLTAGLEENPSLDPQSPQAQALNYRNQLTALTNSSQNSLMAIHQELQSLYGQISNPDLTGEKRQEVLDKHLESSLKTDQTTRQTDQLQQMQKHVTDLYNKGDYQKIAAYESGEQSFISTEKFGDPDLTESVLEQSYQRTDSEAKTELDESYKQREQMAADLDSLAKALEFNSIQSLLEAEKSTLNPFQFYVLNSLKNDGIQEAARASHLNSLAHILRNSNKESANLETQGKLHEAWKEARDAIEFAIKEKGSSISSLTRHYRETAGQAEAQINSTYNSVKQAGIATIAAVVTVGTLGTSSGITLPLMAQAIASGTVAGTLSGALVDATEAKFYEGKNWSQTMDHVTDNLAENFTTSGMSAISAITGQGLAASASKLLTSKISTAALSKLSDNGRKAAEIMFRGSAAGAGQALPSTMNDIAGKVNQRNELRSNLLAQGKSEEEIAAEIKKRGLDNQSITNNTLISLGFGMANGTLGATSNHLSLDSSLSKYMTVAAAEEAIGFGLGVAETMVQGHEYGSQEFNDALATNLAQGFIGRLHGDIAETRARNSKTDSETSKASSDSVEIDKTHNTRTETESTLDKQAIRGMKVELGLNRGKKARAHEGPVKTVDELKQVEIGTRTVGDLKDTANQLLHLVKQENLKEVSSHHNIDGTSTSTKLTMGKDDTAIQALENKVRELRKEGTEEALAIAKEIRNGGAKALQETGIDPRHLEILRDDQGRLRRLSYTDKNDNKIVITPAGGMPGVLAKSDYKVSLLAPQGVKELERREVASIDLAKDGEIPGDSSRAISRQTIYGLDTNQYKTHELRSDTAATKKTIEDEFNNLKSSKLDIAPEKLGRIEGLIKQGKSAEAQKEIREIQMLQVSANMDRKRKLDLGGKISFHSEIDPNEQALIHGYGGLYNPSLNEVVGSITNNKHWDAEVIAHEKKHQEALALKKSLLINHPEEFIQALSQGTIESLDLMEQKTIVQNIDLNFEQTQEVKAKLKELLSENGLNPRIEDYQLLIDRNPDLVQKAAEELHKQFSERNPSVQESETNSPKALAQFLESKISKMRGSFLGIGWSPIEARTLTGSEIFKAQRSTRDHAAVGENTHDKNGFLNQQNYKFHREEAEARKQGAEEALRLIISDKPEIKEEWQEFRTLQTDKQKTFSDMSKDDIKLFIKKSTNPKLARSFIENMAAVQFNKTLIEALDARSQYLNNSDKASEQEAYQKLESAQKRMADITSKVEKIYAEDMTQKIIPDESKIKIQTDNRTNNVIKRIEKNLESLTRLDPSKNQKTYNSTKEDIGEDLTQLKREELNEDQRKSIQNILEAGYITDPRTVSQLAYLTNQSITSASYQASRVHSKMASNDPESFKQYLQEDLIPRFNDQIKKTKDLLNNPNSTEQEIKNAVQGLSYIAAEKNSLGLLETYKYGQEFSQTLERFRQEHRTPYELSPELIEIDGLRFQDTPKQRSELIDLMDNLTLAPNDFEDKQNALRELADINDVLEEQLESSETEVDLAKAQKDFNEQIAITKFEDFNNSDRERASQLITESKQLGIDTSKLEQALIEAGNFDKAIQLTNETDYINQKRLDQYKLDYDHNTNPESTILRQTSFASKTNPELLNQGNPSERTAKYIEDNYGVTLDPSRATNEQLKELGLEPFSETLTINGEQVSITGVKMLGRNGEGLIPSNTSTVRLSKESIRVIEKLLNDGVDPEQFPRAYFGGQDGKNRPNLEGEEVNRFILNGNLGGQIYHPPGSETAAIKSSENPLYITESTMKAIKLAQTQGDSAHVLGLNGIDSYKQDGKPNPQFAKMNLEGRTVVLVPDSDYKTDKQVKRSTDALAEHLTSLGAKVEILDVPLDQGKSIGIDDYLNQDANKDNPRAALEKLDRVEYTRNDKPLPRINKNRQEINESEYKQSGYQNMYEKITDQNGKTKYIAKISQKEFLDFKPIGKGKYQNSQDEIIDGKTYGKYKEFLTNAQDLNARALDYTTHSLHEIKQASRTWSTNSESSVKQVKSDLETLLDLRPTSNEGKTETNELIIKATQKLIEAGNFQEAANLIKTKASKTVSQNQELNETLQSGRYLEYQAERKNSDTSPKIESAIKKELENLIEARIKAINKSRKKKKEKPLTETEEELERTKVNNLRTTEEWVNSFKKDLSLTERYAEEYKRKTGVELTDLQKSKVFEEMRKLDLAIPQIKAIGNDKIDPNLRDAYLTRLESYKTKIAELAGTKGIKESFEEINNKLNKEFIDDPQKKRFEGDLFEIETAKSTLTDILGHQVHELGKTLFDKDGNKEIEIDAISSGKIKLANGQEIEGNFHTEAKSSLAAALRLSDTTEKSKTQAQRVLSQDEKTALLKDKFKKNIEHAKANGARSLLIFNTFTDDGSLSIRNSTDQNNIKEAAKILTAVPELIILNQNGQDIRGKILEKARELGWGG